MLDASKVGITYYLLYVYTHISAVPYEHKCILRVLYYTEFCCLRYGAHTHIAPNRVSYTLYYIYYGSEDDYKPRVICKKFCFRRVCFLCRELVLLLKAEDKLHIVGAVWVDGPTCAVRKTRNIRNAMRIIRFIQLLMVYVLPETNTLLLYNGSVFILFSLFCSGGSLFCTYRKRVTYIFVHLRICGAY